MIVLYYLCPKFVPLFHNTEVNNPRLHNLYQVDNRQCCLVSLEYFMMSNNDNDNPYYYSIFVMNYDD